MTAPELSLTVPCNVAWLICARAVAAARQTPTNTVRIRIAQPPGVSPYETAFRNTTSSNAISFAARCQAGSWLLILVSPMSGRGPLWKCALGQAPTRSRAYRYYAIYYIWVKTVEAYGYANMHQ